MKRIILLSLLFVLIMTVPVMGQGTDFLNLSTVEDEGIILSEDVTLQFITFDGVFRNPFADYRPQEEPEEPEEEVDLPGAIPFVLRGIINYGGRQAALLEGPQVSEIGFEGDVVSGYRITGIYEDADMIALNYDGETIRMRIGGDIIDRQD